MNHKYKHNYETKLRTSFRSALITQLYGIFDYSQNENDENNDDVDTDDTAHETH